MSKTLAQIIASYEAHSAAQPILTPLGQTTSTLFRLKRQVRGLDAEDRTVALAQFRAVLTDLEVTA